jgi:hypothetical protein
VAQRDGEEVAILERLDHALDVISRPRNWPRFFTRRRPVGQDDTPVNIIDLLEDESHPRQPVARLILLMVFLLLVKDRASGMRFEPSEFPEDECAEGDERVGFRMFYEVDGTEYELVPPPRSMMRPMALELEALAGLTRPRTLLANALRRLASKIDGQESMPRRGGFRIRIKETYVDVIVWVYSSDLGDRYFLQLKPESELASILAWQKGRRLYGSKEDRLCPDLL